MTEGVDRKTGAPTTRRDSAIFAFKSAKGVWGKTRVFPHSFFKIICRFDFIDSLLRRIIYLTNEPISTRFPSGSAI